MFNPEWKKSEELGRYISANYQILSRLDAKQSRSTGYEKLFLATIFEFCVRHNCTLVIHAKQNIINCDTSIQTFYVYISYYTFSN